MVNDSTALSHFNSHQDIEVSTPLLSSIIEELSTQIISFTGERFVFGSGVEIFYEHYHRYLYASRAVNKEDIVLDLGCGIGYGSILLSEKVKKVIAIDRDPESIKNLDNLITKYNIKNIETQVLDISDITKLKTSGINVVVCHELIEHISRNEQLSLIKKISSGKEPFTNDVKLFISTPERKAYSEKNRSKNPFHEFEFSKDEFIDFISSQFSHKKFLWQGNITGNILFSEAEIAPAGVGFVNWKNFSHSIGSVQDIPEPKGIYLYAIASHAQLPDIKPSILVDQFERMVMEKLAIAAQELNEKEIEIRKARQTVNEVTAQLEVQELNHKKIKQLLRDNENLGADLQDAYSAVQKAKKLLREYEEQIATTQSHREALLPWRNFVQSRLDHNLNEAEKSLNQMREWQVITQPLEIRAAIAIVRKMPNFIRITVRKFLALVIAIIKG